MSTLASNLNFKANILDIADRKNLIYITKFRLPLSVNQYINSHQILNNIYIHNSTIVSDIELNLWVVNFPKSSKIRSNLVIKQMLEVFYNEFYEWRYTKLSKLNWYIKGVFKENFMTKEICINKLNGQVNQYLANLIID